jgi:hypothetical protein
MVNPTNIEHIRCMQRMSEPVICQFLTELSEDWDLHTPIRTISAQFFDYAWYIQARGVSVVMAINFRGKDPASNTWRLELGKLAYVQPPMGIFRTLVSFPLSPQGFADAMDWIEDHGPQYFYE